MKYQKKNKAMFTSNARLFEVNVPDFSHSLQNGLKWYGIWLTMNDLTKTSIEQIMIYGFHFQPAVQCSI